MSVKNNIKLAFDFAQGDIHFQNDLCVRLSGVEALFCQ
ncbi:hypothetical protein PMI10_03596, partial [Flavobacterium sp. CF136]